MNLGEVFHKVTSNMAKIIEIMLNFWEIFDPCQDGILVVQIQIQEKR